MNLGHLVLNKENVFDRADITLVLTMLNCISSNCVGHKRFQEDIYMMLGFNVNYYWIGTWKIIAPLIVVVSRSKLLA